MKATHLLAYLLEEDAETDVGPQAWYLDADSIDDSASDENLEDLKRSVFSPFSGLDMNDLRSYIRLHGFNANNGWKLYGFKLIHAQQFKHHRRDNQIVGYLSRMCDEEELNCVEPTKLKLEEIVQKKIPNVGVYVFADLDFWPKLTLTLMVTEIPAN